jgi:hypothetical protein
MEVDARRFTTGTALGSLARNRHNHRLLDGLMA